MIYGNMLCV
jgi:ankyrin repeat protein